MIKKFNIEYLFLLVIIILGMFLRLYHISSVPPHLTPDEAAIGYNAYSILKTGKDEYGEFLPIIFKSFGDYKPGLYIYATVPFVKVFGLTEMAVRLPSVIAGLLAIILVYFITHRLSEDNKLAYFASLLLALNPWHIIFSRGAWEANLSLTLTLAGVYFFLVSLKKEKYLVLSALFFGLTFLTYQGAKLSTTIVVLILLGLSYRSVLVFKKKTLVRAFIIGFLLSTPVLLSIFQGKAGRLTVFSVFSYRRVDEYLLPLLARADESKGSLNYYMFHSEPYSMLKGILGRYFNHFSGRFLFIEGDWQNPRHSIPYHGMLTLADFPLLIIGLVSLIQRKRNTFSTFVLAWLVLAPLPSVLSRDQVHAIRSMHLLVPLVSIIGYGAYILFKKYKLLGFIFIPIYAVSYIYFLDAYFIHLPKAYSQYWDYGYKQIVETVTPLQDQFELVRIQHSYAQPYIYFLFYQQYDPEAFQAENRWIPGESALDVGKVEHLDNLYFGPIDWTLNRGDTETLFVADTVRIPPEDSDDPAEFKIHNEIKYLNGKTAFRVISVNKEK